MNLALILLLLFPSVCHANTRDGLVGWWKIDEGNGNNIFDSSSNGNTGTFNSTPPWRKSCSRGNCLNFDGTDDFINIGDKDVLDFGTNSFTYSAWFYGSSVNSFIINKRSASNTVGYDFLSGAGGIVGNMVCRIQDNTDAVSSATWSGTGDEKWHLAVCIINRSSQEISLYGDGVLIGSASSISAVDSVSNGIPFQIGARNSAGAFYTGKIDDVRVYNRALTAQEIKDIYNSGIILRGTGTILRGTGTKLNY